MNDTISQFRTAIQTSGMRPPENIKVGKLYRFPGIGESNSDLAGWCILFADGLGGCFGDSSWGFYMPWHTPIKKPLTVSERDIFLQHAEEVNRHVKKDAANTQLALPIWTEDAREALTDVNKSSSRQKNESDETARCLRTADPSLLDWPELVKLDIPNLPRLDLKHLPVWAGDYARALSTATETPPELAAGMVLVSCATATARCLRVLVKQGYSEPCNVWVLVALPSGNRKSAVQTAAIAPLVEWERDQSRILAPGIKRITSERKTIEARIREARNKVVREKDNKKSEAFSQLAADLESSLPDIPMPPQLWTSDATPERLGSLLAENGECMAWLSSEGGVFDMLQGRYSNGIPNLDLVLKAHSGDAERVDRGSRPPVILNSPRLSIGLSPQPDVLRGLASRPGFRGRGLLARFLYFLPPSPLGYRKLESSPIPESVLDNYSAGIRAMLAWGRAIDGHGEERPHLLQLSNGAYAKWHAFAQAIEGEMRPGGRMEYFIDWAAKAPGAAVRLAGILHGIKYAHGAPWEAVISTETMNDSLEIMAVFTRHSLAALDTMGTDPLIAAARQLWVWIERNKLGIFSMRDAFNALRGRFPRVRNIRDALEALQERGYVEIMESRRNGPGRPASPTILVRQEIREGWR